MTADEKIYNIPLREFYSEAGRRKKSPKAIKGIIDFLSKRVRNKNLVISTRVNEYIWSRGVSKPPGNIRIKVKTEGEKVIADLVETRSKFVNEKAEEVKPKTPEEAVKTPAETKEKA